jgi:hypothetical protein
LRDPGLRQAANGGACARRLRFDSTKEVFPGGPVSTVPVASKKMCGVSRIASWWKAELIGRRSIMAGAVFFGCVVGIVLRFLQHWEPLDFRKGVVGFERNGQLFWAVFCLAAIAGIAQ